MISIETSVRVVIIVRHQDANLSKLLAHLAKKIVAAKASASLGGSAEAGAGAGSGASAEQKSPQPQPLCVITIPRPSSAECASFVEAVEAFNYIQRHLKKGTLIDHTGQSREVVLPESFALNNAEAIILESNYGEPGSDKFHEALFQRVNSAAPSARLYAISKTEESLEKARRFFGETSSAAAEATHVLAESKTPHRQIVIKVLSEIRYDTTHLSSSSSATSTADSAQSTLYSPTSGRRSDGLQLSAAAPPVAGAAVATRDRRDPRLLLAPLPRNLRAAGGAATMTPPARLGRTHRQRWAAPPPFPAHSGTAAAGVSSLPPMHVPGLQPLPSGSSQTAPAMGLMPAAMMTNQAAGSSQTAPVGASGRQPQGHHLSGPSSRGEVTAVVNALLQQAGTTATAPEAFSAPGSAASTLSVTSSAYDGGEESVEGRRRRRRRPLASHLAGVIAAMPPDDREGGMLLQNAHGAEAASPASGYQASVEEKPNAPRIADRMPSPRQQLGGPPSRVRAQAHQAQAAGAAAAPTVSEAPHATDTVVVDHQARQPREETPGCCERFCRFMSGLFGRSARAYRVADVVSTTRNDAPGLRRD